MSQQKRVPFDWAFWFQWTAATTMGWILGQVLLPGLALVVTGLAIGVLQWLSLMHRLPQAWRWLTATILGWALGGVIVLFAVPVDFEFYLVGPILGAATGLGQWFVLRRTVQWAGWWIVISALGWTTGLSLLPGMLLTGVMVGATTGVALELLLRHPKVVQA